MAITFNCPHCQLLYRLKDEFAGKKATCKNPDCRKVITIPAPVTVPDDTPLPSAAELEAAALSALADEAPKQQEKAPAEKVIPMTCSFCDHKWTEPWSKAGKNILCPNPECRQRLKVPEPKEETPLDWRQKKSNLPSMAAKNFEKLEGVEDAADIRYVKAESLQEAGATGVEIEPRPLKQKILIGLMAVGLLVSLVGGIWYLSRSRTTGKEDQLMADARKELDEAGKELAPGEAGLYSAVLNVAAAEYALRHNTPEKLKEAHGLFAKAQDDLRKQPVAPARNAVVAELALTAISLGGTDEQVKAQTRYRWLPDPSSRPLRVNERTPTIHEELRQVLALLLPADFEFKIGVARLLTRELVKKGQAEFAADIVPLFLFTDLEKDEARAVVALELYRADRGSAVARRIAEELKVKLTVEIKAKSIKGNPFPASAQTLFEVLPVDKAPLVVAPPPKQGQVNDTPRQAYVGILLLKDNSGEALTLAQRQGDVVSQMKALVLCAEWMPDPTPALEAAKGILDKTKGKRDFQLSASAILRLSQIAAASGRVDHARTLADVLPDDALKAWAKGDVVHQRVAADLKEKPDETWAELPDEVKKLKVGHAWGRLWVARRNAMISGDRSAEKKAIEGWPAAIRPFGLAGIALGLQDR